MQRDTEAVAAVFIPSLESLSFLPVLHTHDEDRAFIREVLVRNEVLVAEEDGRIVGFAALSDDELEHL